jgi:hypothetical protein
MQNIAFLTNAYPKRLNNFGLSKPSHGELQCISFGYSVMIEFTMGFTK